MNGRGWAERIRPGLHEDHVAAYGVVLVACVTETSCEVRLIIAKIHESLPRSELQTFTCRARRLHGR